MHESYSPDRYQVLYEKSAHLRVHSGALLDKAQELCRTSGRLRETNTILAEDLRVIRSSLSRFAGDPEFVRSGYVRIRLLLQRF